MVQQGDQDEDRDRDADQPQQNVAPDVAPIGSGSDVSFIRAPAAPTTVPPAVPQLPALDGRQACGKGADEYGSSEPERQLGSRAACGVERLPCGDEDLVPPFLGVRLTKAGARGDELGQIASVLRAERPVA